MYGPYDALKVESSLREASLSATEYQFLARQICRLLSSANYNDWFDQSTIMKSLSLLQRAMIIHPPIVYTEVKDSTILHCIMETCQKELCMGGPLTPDVIKSSLYVVG